MANNVHENAINLLRSRRLTKMNTLRPGLATKFPNSSFEQPSDQAWTDWHPAFAHATQLAASRSAGERRMGTIIEEINVPRLMGELLPAQIGDDICTVWRPDSIDDSTVIPYFRFFASTVTETGIAKDDPNWFRVSVITPFWLDSIIS